MAYIVFKPTSSISNHESIIELDGVNYIFRFTWNDRTKNWYLRVLLEDGTVLQGDKKICVNTAILQDLDSNIPSGSFFTIGERDPLLSDLSTNFKFIYFGENDELLLE